jgi:hypothetical protein
MKKWAFAITVAFFAIVSVAAGAVALTDEDGGGDGARVAREADDGGESGGDGSAADCANPPCEDVVDGGAAGICLEGAVDCDDTPDEAPPADGVCIQIFPTPPECTDPDAPVSNEPPTSGDGIDPNECSLVHNIEACEKNAVAIATEDLANRLGSADGITLKGVGFVEWPDACLGIEQPDVACAEVITPGYRVLLEANGQLYDYHTDTGSRAVLVE